MAEGGRRFIRLMHHSASRKNLALAYVTSRPLAQVLEALDEVPRVIPSAVVRFASPVEVRVEIPGSLVTFLVQANQDCTRLVAKFKSCARSAWRKIMEILHASVQVRRTDLNVGIVAAKPVATCPPRRVSDVVERFTQDKATSVVFAPKALRQAKESGFRYPEHVEQALHRLTIATRLLNAGLSPGETMREVYVIRAGLRGYRPRLSDTQRTAYRDDYTAIYDGEEFVGEMHVTIGRGGEADCLSIHWAYCRKRRLIIITRCCTHGRTARS
jgi:hypothetical protein